ncbi:hypothetical protein [Aureivirga marina]|uniref:hypothetical protein n=1 Tax=Aureivirga marina TaxID=1182451 RepID=UPI0018CB3B80|nr:hypothetical protein [Aureivirga marina]
MKKFAVLFGIFVLPLMFYIFLSTGDYQSSSLPVLTKNVKNIEELEGNTDGVTYRKKFTVLTFLGTDYAQIQASVFNLNQTIYKRYNQKMSGGKFLFQIVAIYPKGSEAVIEKVKNELGAFSNTKRWHFIPASSNEITELFTSLDSPYSLDENYFTQYAFIIGQKGKLRGRTDDEDYYDHKLYGYDMTSVAELKDKMIDDINILFYKWSKITVKKSKENKES